MNRDHRERRALNRLEHSAFPDYSPGSHAGGNSRKMFYRIATAVITNPMQTITAAEATGT